MTMISPLAISPFKVGGGRQGALELTFDDIAYVPVVDASSVSDWNDFFDLPANGTPFSSVVVEGDVVKLYGGRNITLKASLFSSDNPHIIDVTDNAHCVVAANDNAFAGSPLLRTSVLSSVSLPVLTTLGDYVFFSNILLASVNLPKLETIGDATFSGCEILESVRFPLCTSMGNECFYNCYALTTIYIPLCTSLGDDTGDNDVFQYISGNTITLTMPIFLMTCHFDGMGWTIEQDISYLIDNNTVTIIAISDEIIKTLADGLIVYHKRLSEGVYYLEKSDDGGVTWDTLVTLQPDETSIIITMDSSPEGYREVIRDDAYCIDHELTETGFAGDENTDWENIYNTNTL